jgi:DNA-binding NtrC family response regulator
MMGDVRRPNDVSAETREDRADALSDNEISRIFSRLQLFGRSPAFLNALRSVHRFAGRDAPLLVLGPTGTGKELVARAAHELSARRDRPFIPVNCGGLPDNLFENELFGHERGAYTGATEARGGLIAHADTGTLLLDEIDSLSTRGQIALLRFLQDGCYRPLGGTRLRKADVRIVAASNADLDRLVSLGKFRQDLLYRIDVMRVRLPALAERDDDVLLLAQHFLRHFAESYDQPTPQLDPAFAAWLQAQPWPGNVRELDNTLHRLFLLADGGRLEPPDALSGRVADDCTAPFNEARQAVVNAFERRYLERLMAAAHGNVSEAARRAGKERKAFGRLLKKHDLRRDDFLAR